MRRSALPPKTRLRQNDSHVIYEIQEQIGQGGSALIYRVVKYDRHRQSNVILKEIYPASDRGVFFIRLPDGSLVPGSVDHDGETVPAEEDSYFYDNGWEVLGRLQEQLWKEERIGSRLRDDSFLVCSLKVLEGVHLENEEKILDGWAEMPDMSGSSVVLEKYLEELETSYNGCIPIGKSLHLLKEIAGTMEKIHDAGYLYGDFSLRNIFLLKNTLTAVFIDFGSTLQKLDAGDGQEVSVLASYGYRAPELFKRTVTEASDVYSLASFFFRLVGGKEFAEEYDEFAKTSDNIYRIIKWNRMKKIGVANPAAGLVLNRIFVEGLTRDYRKRTGNIRKLLELADQVEKLQNLGGNLFESLRAVYRWGYRERIHGGAYVQYFARAVPDYKSLERAWELLGKELLDRYDSREVYFIFYWMEVWYRGIAETEKISSEKRKNTDALRDYCAVAVFNHRGEYANAIRYFDDFKENREEIELPKYLDMRLRAAESYANFFDYETALSIVKENLEVLEMRKKCYQEMAGKLGFQTEHAAKTTELAKNYSAAGRYCSFLGSSGQRRLSQEARGYFGKAIDEFGEDEMNKSRTRLYMLQMAAAKRNRRLFYAYRRNVCEFGDRNLSLEKQVTEILLSREKQKDCYLLYALLKGVRAFGGNRFGEDFLAAVSGLAGQAQSWEKQWRNHPWELIYRQAAILLAEHRKCVDDEVRTLFAASRRCEKVLTKLDGSVVDKQPFDTILALHMATFVMEYELCARFAGIEEDKADYMKRLEESMELLFCYLEKSGCNTRLAGQWAEAASAQERFGMLMEKFTYEYE